jgi:hypothetical protein
VPTAAQLPADGHDTEPTATLPPRAGNPATACTGPHVPAGCRLAPAGSAVPATTAQQAAASVTTLSTTGENLSTTTISAAEFRKSPVIAATTSQPGPSRLSRRGSRGPGLHRFVSHRRCPRPQPDPCCSGSHPARVGFVVCWLPPGVFWCLLRSGPRPVRTRGLRARRRVQQ